MATYRKRGESWQAIVDRHGVFKSKSFPTKSHAVAWATQIESEILSGKRTAVSDKTFGDLLTKYSEEVSPTKRGKRWEQIRIDLIKTYPIAKVRLSDLNATHFAEWRDTRLKQVSAASVRREWNILSNAMKVAQKEWHWVTHNHLSDIKRPPAPPGRDRRITGDEINRLIHSSGYDRDVAPDTLTGCVMASFLFAIETAMRVKEITTLTPDLVDLDKRTCRVLPDSKTGKREVPLSAEAIRIINQMTECQIDRPNIFKVTPAQVDALFRKIRSNALIDDLHFHDTKHEACTRLAEKVNVFDLARIVGTRDLKTLMIYFNKSASDIAAQL